MQIFILVYLSKEIYSDKGCNYYKDHKDALTNETEVLSNLGTADHSNLQLLSGTFHQLDRTLEVKETNLVHA